MGEIAGIDVSAVGLGCNNFGMTIDQEQTTRVVQAAVDAGITFFDTADVYAGTQSEVFLGRALGRRRAEVVVATKFGLRVGELPGGLRPADIRRALEASLRRLGTDYVDLYLLHYPSSWMVKRGYPDADVAIAETLAGLDELVREGKVRSVGCSNFSAAELREADDAARSSGTARFSSVQNGLSLLDRQAEADVLPLCVERDIAFVPYFPLASGMLTGKYRRGEDYPTGSRMDKLPEGMWTALFTDENFDRVERLEAVAVRSGHTLLDLAVSWLLTRPAVASVIAGATSADQVRANLAAAEWRLSPEEMAAVDEALVATVPEPREPTTRPSNG